MNTLSWTLYFAGVVESVSVLAFLTCLGWIGYMGVIRFARSMEDQEMPEGDGRRVAICLAVMFAIMFIPSKSTIYMIAASEVGGQVAQSEEAKELYGLLRAKIMEALKVSAK